jgi:hypothetical protein
MSNIASHTKANQAVVRFWIWKQRTDERVYVSTAAPGPRARAGLRADGYKLYAVDVRLPDEAFVPEHDAVLEAGAELLDGSLVHVGDRIELTGHYANDTQTGHCSSVTGIYIAVRWDKDGMEGSYTPSAFRELVASGRLKVNP